MTDLYCEFCGNELVDARATICDRCLYGDEGSAVAEVKDMYQDEPICPDDDSLDQAVAEKYYRRL